jgi:ABC-type uncharacterized transport system fused permease/ATPase subunit
VLLVASQLHRNRPRICEDIRNFVKSSTTVNLLLVKKLLNCVAFAGVLWSISPRLVLFLLSYAALGTAVTTCCFGRLLMRLQVGGPAQGCRARRGAPTAAASLGACEGRRPLSLLK